MISTVCGLAPPEKLPLADPREATNPPEVSQELLSDMKTRGFSTCARQIAVIVTIKVSTRINRIR
jgi:hypothetical protein